MVILQSVNRFYKNREVFEPYTDAVLNDAQNIFFVLFVISILIILYHITKNQPEIEEKTILFGILSVILMLTYQDTTMAIQKFSQGIDKMFIENVTPATKESSIGRGRFEKKTYYVGGEGIFSGYKSEKQLRFHSGDYTSSPQILAYLYFSKNQKKLNRASRKIVRDIQFIYSLILYTFIGPLMLALSVIWKQNSFRFLAEFLNVNLWSVGITAVDQITYFSQSQGGDLGGLGVTIMYALVPVMTSLAVPGTFGNMVMQKVIGFGSMAAGMAGMASRFLIRKPSI